jgi:hypothetical protein
LQTAPAAGSASCERRPPNPVKRPAEAGLYKRKGGAHAPPTTT